MNEYEILGNISKGKIFLEELEKKDFLFSFIISYTQTSEIPGITFAGSNAEMIPNTPPADAEFLYYGSCKSIKGVPTTPDGKPTPALLTKVALESASIPHIVVNAGSKIAPQIPYYHTGLEFGKNITQGDALSDSCVLNAIDQGRIIGRTLASITDCLIIGESIPGGTTTAQAVMKAMGLDVKSSSSMPKNPVALKEKILENALGKLQSKDPFQILAQVGDPLIPFVAGMLSSASEVTKVILAGGTQMAAVLALGKSLGFNKEKTSIGTTKYLIDDEYSNFEEIIKKLADIPIFVVNPKLENSQFEGLQAFSKGYAKDGAGAGGCILASMLKAGISSEKFLKLTEKEYSRIFT